MEYVTAEALTKSHLPEDDVPLDDVGLIRVRGLSRQEVLDMPDTDGEGGLIAQNRYIVARGMVRPAMTEDAVEAWMGAGTSPEVNKALAKIGELSGLTPTAAKDVTRELLTDHGAQFRDVPSGATEDDRRPAAEDAGG